MTRGRAVLAVLATMGLWAASGCGGDATATGGPGTAAGTGAVKPATGDADFTKTEVFKRVDTASLKLENGGKFLPTDPVDGMVVVAVVRYYGKDNLSELIDGEAESYVSYGVKELATTEYAPDGGTDPDARVTAHIYDMGTPLMAFGRYAEHKNDEYRYEKLGTDGFAGGSNVIFYKGQYLVELSAGTAAPDMEKKLLSLARAIEAKLPAADGAELAPLAKLPADGRRAHTERYAVENVSELDGLGAGFWVRYDVGGKEARVFVNPTASADAAKAAFAAAKTAVGGAPAPAAGVAEEALAAKTEYHGESVIFRKGNTVGGVTELADRAAAVELAKKVAAGL
jgi:hypothetical protein